MPAELPTKTNENAALQQYERPRHVLGNNRVAPGEKQTADGCPSMSPSHLHYLTMCTGAGDKTGWDWPRKQRLSAEEDSSQEGSTRPVHSQGTPTVSL